MRVPAGNLAYGDVVAGARDRAAQRLERGDRRGRTAQRIDRERDQRGNAVAARSLDDRVRQRLRGLDGGVARHRVATRGELACERRGVRVRLRVHRRSADQLVLGNESGRALLRELTRAGACAVARCILEAGVYLEDALEEL